MLNMAEGSPLCFAVSCSFASPDGIIWVWSFEGHPQRVGVVWKTVWEVRVSFVEELASSLTG
jgi:hypothetical protein